MALNYIQFKFTILENKDCFFLWEWECNDSCNGVTSKAVIEFSKFVLC